MQLTDDNISDYADTLVQQVRGGGRTLDYAEESLQTVEELLRLSDELFRLETFPENQRSLTVFYNGCYVGMVMERNLGGVWQFEENWYDSFLLFPYGAGGLQTHPFQKVYRRLTEDPVANNLVEYYAEIKRLLGISA